MGTWRITEADRNADGKIISSAFGDAPAEPRSLADLLPKPESIKQDARPQRQKLTRQELAMLAGVAILAVFILAWAWLTPSAPVADPTARPTLIPTLAATAAPTAAPAPPVGACGLLRLCRPRNGDGDPGTADRARCRAGGRVALGASWRGPCVGSGRHGAEWRPCG
jgi:hypothetical protein